LARKTAAGGREEGYEPARLFGKRYRFTGAVALKRLLDDPRVRQTLGPFIELKQLGKPCQKRFVAHLPEVCDELRRIAVPFLNDRVEEEERHRDGGEDEIQVGTLKG
jgi:hypothetical protein